MATILWQSRSPVVYDSFSNKLLMNAANGGNAYDFQAMQVLSKHFSLGMDQAAVKQPGERIPGYWWRMLKNELAADVVIMEPFPIIFGSRKIKSKSVAMIHHIEEKGGWLSLKHRWFFNRLRNQLREMNLVITVSGYWADYLKTIGCSNVKIIYNAFNPSDYLIGGDAVQQFKKKYDFNEQQPIVYIGNASRQKGVYEVYEALKNYNYQLVMTGAENRAGDLPVKFLNLNRTDYITLLHAAGVVVTMSKLTEGWNRIAHEALLCKTPVIGSGTGGMRELLEGASQKIVEDFSVLHFAVQDVLENKTELGDYGYAFVSQYDPTYFEKEWVNTIENLLKN